VQTLRLQRLLLALVPALVMASVVVSTIWGDKGLLARHHLRQELTQAQVDLAVEERDNQRLLRELSVLERDPQVVERLLAEELRWGRPGAVLYDFSQRPVEGREAEVAPPWELGPSSEDEAAGASPP
jgi:hypothetical protein